MGLNDYHIHAVKENHGIKIINVQKHEITRVDIQKNMVMSRYFMRIPNKTIIMQQNGMIQTSSSFIFINHILD